MQKKINHIKRELHDQFAHYNHDFSSAIGFYIDELTEKAERCDNLEDVIADFSMGCSSGVVSGLIYHSDTLAFFEENKLGIAELLLELQDDTGENWINIFRDIDKDDIFCDEPHNKNQLAWYLFKEINYRAEMILENTGGN
jgi:hypothetical protein